MDNEIKEIMKKLGTAINESLQESDKIQKLLQEIERKGYNLTLSMAVIVGLNSLNLSKGKTSLNKDVREEDLDVKQTAFDRKFLKALRIKISEEKK